jgi:hypothetical protein
MGWLMFTSKTLYELDSFVSLPVLNSQKQLHFYNDTSATRVPTKLTLAE